MNNPILVWSYNRIWKKNKNIILVINGATGSGKTYAGLSFAEMLMPIMKTNFTIKNNLDFNFGVLLSKMQMPTNRKPGTIFIFEEVGAVGGGASSKEWQSMTNKLFNSFLQTSRHRQQILIFTCPHFFNLEKSSRQLCHMQWSMQSIDYENNVSFVTPYVLQVNSQTGKIYFKYLRYRIKGENHCLTRLSLNKPSESMIKEYEEAKTKYTDKLNQHIIDSSKVKSKFHNKIDYQIVDALLKQGLLVRDIALKLKCSTKSVKNYRDGIKSEAKSTFSIGNQGIDIVKPATTPSI